MQNCSVRKAAKLNNSKLKSTVSLYVLHNTGVYMYFVDRKTKIQPPDVLRKAQY
jgi:hypothetical protein